MAGQALTVSEAKMATSEPRVNNAAPLASQAKIKSANRHDLANFMKE
jgi:hypothetical protein